MKIEQCINYLLTQAQGKVNNIFRENLSQYGITPAQYVVLYYLWEEDGLSPSQLSQLCALDASTITGLLTRMEKSDLIERRHSRNDRRGVHVFLSGKGRELQGSISRTIEESNEQTLSAFGKAERAQFIELLEKLCGTL